MSRRLRPHGDEPPPRPVRARSSRTSPRRRREPAACRPGPSSARSAGRGRAWAWGGASRRAGTSGTCPHPSASVPACRGPRAPRGRRAPGRDGTRRTRRGPSAHGGARAPNKCTTRVGAHRADFVSCRGPTETGCGGEAAAFRDVPRRRRGSSGGIPRERNPASRSKRQTAFEATIGLVVGASTPPDGSRVTSTLAPGPTVACTGTTSRTRPPAKSPARTGVCPSSTHTS